MHSSKNQKHPLKQKKNAQKKHDIQKFWNAPSLMFLNFKKIYFLRVFFCFFTKEVRILIALMQKILDEIKQSNGIKPPKNLLFKIFCKFLPHKGNFWLKVSSKMTYFPCCQRHGSLESVFCVL